jgi:hypothetical protein
MNKKNFPFPVMVYIFLKDEFKSSKTFMSYPVVLGRSNKWDFPLTEYEFLSRQHCVLHLENNKIYIDKETTDFNFLFSFFLNKLG